MRKALAALQRVVIRDPAELVEPLAVFAITLFVGWLLRRLVLRALGAWTSRSGSRPGLILTEALRGPMLMWALILALHLGVQSSDLPRSAEEWSTKVLSILLIASFTLMGMRLARDLVRYYGGEIPGPLPVTTLTQSLAQIVVLILGILVLFGQNIQRLTPVLTALGVGGLAVALALQDTLSNLFGGFYVAVAGQVRLGDYIKLNTGEEGYVTDIGWRSTTIRALANNLIIVPNAKLAQAIVTNYYLPERSMGASLQVNVSYDCNADKVEQVLLEVATQSAADIPGMLGKPAPSVAFDPAFGDWALGFTVNYQVAEFANQFSVRNELRKRIWRRFQQEGIKIPFPARTVYLSGGDGKYEAAPEDAAGRR